jgi:glycosyltransferase involved in cell wall biosynthesis
MRRKDAIVAIVGPADSAFGQDMRTLAASLGIGERVVFTGLLRGHERLSPLVDADLFCLPSEHENFGVAVVEALAAGCPTIVSEHVGLADEIRRHRLGDVTTLAAESIAEALDRWLDNEAERLSARTAARRHALATYDWTAIAAIWLNEYTAILSRLPHTRDSRTLASSHSERLAAATTGAIP